MQSRYSIVYTKVGLIYYIPSTDQYLYAKIAINHAPCFTLNWTIKYIMIPNSQNSQKRGTSLLEAM